MSNTDESTWPYLFEVLDRDGKRLSMLVAHSMAQASKEARVLFGFKLGSIYFTGQRAKPRKCCDDCPDDKPCGDKS